MKKVIVSVTNNLVTDQRIERICLSLHQLGFEVLLVGRSWPEKKPLKRPYIYKNFKLLFNKNFLFYAEYNLRLFFFLLFQRADILVANDLDTLPSNYLAAKFKGCKVFFDSHEYFSETPEVFQRNFVRKFWLFIEKTLVKGCDAHYTVSASVANIYKQKYGIDFQVIRNVPLRHILPVAEKKSTPLILYQGTLNIGRGLELLIQAVKLLSSANLIIAGDGPEMKNLKELTESLRLKERITFTGSLIPEKLRMLTVQASVGVSLEEPLGKSYISALPNKLFDYIQAGVPVLVSNLPEMAAVVSKYEIGQILNERTPENLAHQLDIMITDEEMRKKWLMNLFQAARELCWENESEKLKTIFE